MNKKDLVILAYIEIKNNQITAKEISHSLDLDKAIVYKSLNELCKNKLIIKLGKNPLMFQINEKEFKKFIH